MKISAFTGQTFHPINVCISGLTAAGKTTHSHLLAGAFGFTYVSASQILLFLAGLNPIQQRDFWLTKRACELWNDEMTIRIDRELRQLSHVGSHYVFDTFAMPWRHDDPCLRIFLHSDLQSRVAKAIVSHRGESTLAPNQCEAVILRKDAAMVESHNRLFGITLDETWAQFDLVLNISSAISEPSFDASQRSIEAVHACLRTAVMYALTGRSKERIAYECTKQKHHHFFIKDRLLG